MAAKKTAVDKKQLETKTTKKAKEKKSLTDKRIEMWLKPGPPYYRRERLTKWGQDGVTKTEIAERMGISLDTLERWEKVNSELSELITYAREKIVERLRVSLVEQAVGYKIKKQVVVQRTGQVVTIEEDVPRNPNALNMALRFFDKVYKQVQDEKIETENKADPLLDGYIGNIEKQVEDTESEDNGSDES